MALVQKSFSDLITFTRASGGGRFNAAGQYEWLPANTPRIDYDPVTGEAKGLLIEEQRTNLLTYSSDFAGAAWGKSGAIVPSDRFAAPDGYASATKLAETTANTNHFLNRQVTITAGSAYSFSVFAKAGERTHAIISFGKASSPYTRIRALVNLVTGEVTSAHVGSPVSATISANPIGGGVYRVAVSGVIDATTTDGYVDVRIYNGAEIYQGDGTSGIYIWGFQLEAGSFPTSHIPTTTAQVTRAADIASVNELSPWFNASEGTLFVEASTTSTRLDRWITLSGAGVNRLFVSRLLNGKMEAYVVKPGATPVGVIGDSTIQSGETAKVAVSLGDGMISMSVNGQSVKTATAAMPDVGAMAIGGEPGATRNINGHIRSLRFYPRKFSDSELQALTV